ncbi:DNA translocase FtsK [Peribacillus alkalitolerans]|uniref:DNA translocase FtsK n=1 Tax=Peribacillus alkalitolerans TaxID=1550385 RepID=UPI0013D3A184|nr:DNA translocase FtsK [Peribacillus alkalitolerans]
MAKRKKRSSKRTETLKHTLKFELIGLTLFGISAIALAKLGAVGRSLVLISRFFMGEWYTVLLISLLILSIFLMWKRRVPFLLKRQLLGCYMIIGSMLLLSHVTLFSLLQKGGPFEKPSVLSNTWELFWMEVNGGSSTSDLGGGMIGATLFAMSYFLFDAAGSKIAAILFIIIGFVLVTGKTMGDVLGKFLVGLGTFSKNQWIAFLEDLEEWKQQRVEKKEKKQLDKELERQAKQLEKEKEKEANQEVIIPVIDSGQERQPTIISSFNETSGVTHHQESKPNHQAEPVIDEVDDEVIGVEIVVPELENVDYELPPLSLLKTPKKADQSGEYELIHTNAAKLEKTFQSFGVKAKVTQVHLGPAVTKYEVHPDVGVKVSKIVSLSDDLALALAAKDIRIEAPIPGKSAIGIEVPNSEIAMVSLREVLESKDHFKVDAKLQIALGRDISGEAVLAELNKMPHLLVAGATGSGKSVCINGIITSILMRAKPHEVKLMMIDPKMVELNVYNGVPHLLAPVVTDAKKASQALKKVVSEMERRYELFSHTGTRNIEGYNEHIRKHNLEEGAKQPFLPYIVVIVDELADLMMVASSDVEDSITRLAQMARAAGIHLIIATQRPSVDVITGVIKANIPSRIAFSVSSMTDSRTILDMGGAEKLLGRGDMLFLPVGASKPVRVQGAFLSDEEVEEVVNFVIGQQKAQYQEEMIPADTPEAVGEVDDDLYDEAVQLVIEMQTASVSMLQRRFRIGYSRAARLIDEMEARGVVGQYEGSKPRNVLIGKETIDQDIQSS